MHLRFVLACSIAVWGLSSAADPPDDDFWTGRPQEEVVRLLGDPSKVKRTSRGTERLIYKLIRVDPTSPIEPGLFPLELPGVGFVARVDPKIRASGVTTTVEPVELDEKGRPYRGGVTSSHSTSVSWDKDGNKSVGSTLEGHPEYRGKVTLKFDLDAGGTITSWSVSPKKAKD